jgi:hypothetical protein
VVSISRNGPTLSHLFFMDDVLLFTKATRSQVFMVEGNLTNFVNMLGLKVNISKSRAFFFSSATTIRSRIESLVATIGIRQSSWLEKYIGFPMVHGRLTKSGYEFSIDKIQRRLAS